MTPLLLAIAAVGLVTVVGDLSEPLQVPPSPPPSGAAPVQPVAKAAPVLSIAGEVTILHATNKGTGIDPKIGNMPALGKPPFSSYNSYKLLERTATPLEHGKAAQLTLPTKRELRIVFKDVIEPQKQGDPRRYVITASIQKADGKSFLPLVEVNAKAGETFWVGGQEFNEGSLFIGIKVNP